MTRPESTISVVMATHNRASLLPRAIESALPQLREDDEFIVVDDGSEDETRQLVSTYGDDLKYVHQVNRGPGAARNRGLAVARGAYVSFLDDDDTYLDNRLDLMRTVLDRIPEAIYAFSSYARVSRSGVWRPMAMHRAAPQFVAWLDRQRDIRRYSELGMLPEGQDDFRVLVGNDYAVQMQVDYVITGVLMVRRQMAGERLRFSEDLRRFEDWDLTSRLVRDAPVAYLETDLYAYHTPPDHRLMDGSLLENSTDRLKVLERVWGRDTEFLREHGAAFHERCNKERLWRASRFITHGQPVLARQELDRIRGNSPLLLRALAKCPPPLLSLLMRSRRAVKRGWRELRNMELPGR